MVAVLIFVMFMLIVAIVYLNLLVAMMTSGYTEVGGFPINLRYCVGKSASAAMMATNERRPPGQARSFRLPGPAAAVQPFLLLSRRFSRFQPTAFRALLRGLATPVHDEDFRSPCRAAKACCPSTKASRIVLARRGKLGASLRVARWWHRLPQTETKHGPAGNALTPHASQATRSSVYPSPCEE